MANYTAADVKKLRELTGAGMMDCKKALDEADGNVDKAVEALRIKGQKGVAKREGRSAENGAVVSLISEDQTSGVLLELKCETDFVAKGEKFQAVANTLAAHVAATSPADLEALLASEIEAGKTVQAYVDEANANLGEKIVLDRFAQFSGAYVSAYMHRTMPDLPPQIGVLVELDKADAELAKGIAQHIAAFAPKYLSREDVPAEVVEAERRVAEETTRAEGKPEAALPKIVEGRVNGFFKEATLLGQPYALDNKKSVQKVLDEAGVTLKRFTRIKVGI
ncbi:MULTISPECIES: translation elongation factor Ts [unclassified Streptomyces]|uniref:translation elongation factor Ts n=1 Tax=unclassified Streptomyces TaxID=2593676 RepID=UPI000F5C1AF5|nr:MULTISPECIES: translation elongation factor Ts [unclassified Streptomyces]WSG53690.1 translation elongation factor Ts [Streptomyces sp. NBC_01732]WSX04345.1 translation elongation factor Ts [Streptomyces sp. NBC_00987]MCX4393574.1 translation elongation factor Ts [Streptomyces sp. NBC_01767]MCX5105525.1 translation elongation factor Ts [Streptomyces sp. NBC_00439]MCX5163328.1 translation elongation factor Ts [Streptomyces sp. NBC_00305]